MSKAKLIRPVCLPGTSTLSCLSRASVMKKKVLIIKTRWAVSCIYQQSFQVMWTIVDKAYREVGEKQRNGEKKRNREKKSREAEKQRKKRNREKRDTRK